MSSYITYANNYKIIDTTDQTWISPEKALGENIALSAFAYTSSILDEWTTDKFNFKFNYLDIENSVPESSIITSLVFEIKYKISSPVNCLGGINKPVLNNDLIDLGYVITSNENTAYQVGTDLGIKTARFTYSGGDTPSRGQIVDNNFGIYIWFDLGLGDGSSLSYIEVYEVLINISYSEATSSLSLYNEHYGDSALPNGTTLNFSDVILGGSTETKFTISNTGAADLIFLTNSIYTTEFSKISILDNPTGSGSLILNAGDSKSFYVALDQSVIGSFDDQFLFFQSNDPITSLFIIRINFHVVAGSSTGPIASFVYNESEIGNHDIQSLASVPKNIANLISLTLQNNGDSNLTITNINLSGDGTVVFGSIGAGSVIPASSTGIYIIALSVASLGNKSMTITMISNDPNNNPYIITINYSVLDQFKLDLTLAGVILVDGTSVSLGTLGKGEAVTKTYTLKNSGVYRSVVINSITTSGDTVVQSKPTLPLTLSPNGANSGNFTIAFPSLVVGLKSGNVIINWNEV